MRLWLDGQCLQSASRFRGIGRYVTELIGGIRAARPDVDLLVSLNAALPEEALAARQMLDGVIAPGNVHVWQGIAEGGETRNGYDAPRRVSEIALAHHVSMLGVDVALSASPFEGGDELGVPYFPLPGASEKSAAIFYDAIPYRYPDRYFTQASAREYYMRRVRKLTSFDHVLAISAFALSELKALAPGARGTNIEAAVAPSFIQLADSLAEPERWPRESSVLYVGGHDWRKNVRSAAAAFEFLPPSLKAQVQFIVAGSGPPVAMDEIRKAWRAAGMAPERLQLLGQVDDEELVRLYHRAGALIQPSFMEGFGLTALEAMYCGAPVIASRGSALGEILPVAEASFDPRNKRDIARRITRVLTDLDFAKRLAKEGRDRALRYSWEKSARTAIAALEKLAPAPVKRESRSAARARAGAALGAISLDPELVARTLAVAEPSMGGARLLVDVTATCDADHGTGIQRVVKKIATHLMEQDEGAGRVGLIYGKTEEGFQNAAVRQDGKIIAADGGARARVPLVRGDTVLMLDSSWEHHLVHRKVLPRALLQGGDVITTLYDLVPVRTPAFCDPGMPPIFAAWLQSALTYSTGFVCISKAVADELMALLVAMKFPRPMKIGYWTLGADFMPVVRAHARPPVSAPSFLMVGTIEPRKGYGVALAAFDALWASGFEGRLTLIGKRGWGVDRFIDQLVSHREFGSRLLWHERVDDAALASAYAETDALIAASYAEGFGLPIVEAGHFDKPVIASDLPVFREVARFAPHARFFETGNATALAAEVRVFIASAASSAQASTLEAPVSWAQSAAQLRDLVTNDAWQMHYRPEAAPGSVAREDLGETRMSSQLPANVGRVDLVDGPLDCANGTESEVIVRATNLTDRAWSSTGEGGDERLGVVLECRVVTEDGRAAPAPPSVVRLPWVMTPGLPHYVRITIPVVSAPSAARARIALRQIGGDEISSPLVLPLNRLHASASVLAE